MVRESLLHFETDKEKLKMKMGHFWTSVVDCTTDNTLSEKLKRCHKEGSNSRQKSVSLTPSHYVDCFHEQL